MEMLVILCEYLHCTLSTTRLLMDGGTPLDAMQR
jgi:hypothetical protein